MTGPTGQAAVAVRKLRDISEGTADWYQRPTQKQCAALLRWIDRQARKAASEADS